MTSKGASSTTPTFVVCLANLLIYLARHRQVVQVQGKPTWATPMVASTASRWPMSPQSPMLHILRLINEARDATTRPIYHAYPFSDPRFHMGDSRLACTVTEPRGGRRTLGSVYGGRAHQGGVGRTLYLILGGRDKITLFQKKI
jgi:hypothetical protein